MNDTFYFFLDCPYTQRARLALLYSQQPVLVKEIDINNKPKIMTALENEQACVVLQLSNTNVLDESLDIMIWALEQSDPDGWLTPKLTEMLNLIDENDFNFKPNSDKYRKNIKQPIGTYYRDKAEDFLFTLESKLLASPYLFGNKISLADIAIFPFIQEFAAIDPTYFEHSPYPHLQKWLDDFIASPLFALIQKK